MKTKVIFSLSLVFAIISTAMFLVLEPGITPPYQAIVMLFFVVATVITFGMGIKSYLETNR